MTGAVERYLDEMFDRLAGTGPGGRRMLAETESHLLDAVEDGRARGLTDEDAEKEAVARFGAVGEVVRDTRDVRGMLFPLIFAAGIGMLWWGGSGVVAWLLTWPWTRLLIETDRFGHQPDVCERPWIARGADCFTQYRDYLDLVPGSGDRDTYPWVALGGVLLLIAWRLLRRTATPVKPIAVVFGLAALVLTGYGVTGLAWQVQNWALSYLTAGLFAAGICVVAVIRAPRRAR